MHFVPVQSFANYIEAHMAMGNMKNRGIDCWLKDEYTVTIDPMLTNAIGGIKLMVEESQAAAAIEVLQQLADEKKEHYACPYCGSHNIERISRPRKAVNWLSAFTTWLLGSYAVTVHQAWHCFTCGKECKQPADTSIPA